MLVVGIRLQMNSLMVQYLVMIIAIIIILLLTDIATINNT